ncbi:VOC family protein [Tunturiibacter gelidoferens]|uniref:Catechol 2,3-dioxygenase-like lactoylglutathione lyase family enzyme n=1 Tax=Tunturiibacter gelidiferens TaxID=3069689 RepID=A0ACC5P170_9BACT|nr:VOC family protein [Edaphobacter lichenicola]MBB5340567.1 catechol 2,3-dioxygenase-like lactoylglutathione lyase family enzyme [Edaphobacter lichenicola]
MIRQHRSGYRSARPAGHRVLFSLVLFLFAPLLHAQPDTKTPPFNGIAHVALRVHDLANSLAFYEKLGFEQAFDLRKENVPYESFIKINDTQFIELHAAAPADTDTGFLSLCFEGADVQAINNDYLSHGLIPTPVRKTDAGNLRFIMGGPTQVSGPQIIEYTQYVPGSLHSNDQGKHLGPERVAEKLIAISLPMADPSSARDFYINQLNFKPIANDPMSLHMPGESGQEVEIMPATPGSHARITLESTNLGKAARHLHKEGIFAVKNGTTLTVIDPDGNVLLLETR